VRLTKRSSRVGRETFNRSLVNLFELVMNLLEFVANGVSSEKD
jgi:hypothetical protein